MASLSIEEIEKLVGSRYAMTVLAGKRARELRDGAPRLVNSDANNPIHVALQEILEGKIKAENLDYSVGQRPGVSTGSPVFGDSLVFAGGGADLEDDVELGDDETETAAVPGSGAIGGEADEPLALLRSKDADADAAVADDDETPAIAAPVVNEDDADDTDDGPYPLAEGAAEPEVADPSGDDDTIDSLQG